MTAAELRAILTHVPDDTLVVVDGRGPAHIGVVDRRGSRRVPKVAASHYCETGRCQIVEHGWVEEPSHVVLRPHDGYGVTRPPRPSDPPPAFRLKGPFQRKRALAAELDALDPMPAPEGEAS